MRFYVFTTGSPGYISAEVAVRELSDEHEARAWANDTWIPWWSDSARIISHSEALMVPLYRDALERWERRDDAILQATEVAEVLDGRRQEAVHFAKLGCREAIAAVADQDDERIRFVVMEHGHDERCGGRDFPDERRALQVVS
jgi:hypothetical protein